MRQVVFFIVMIQFAWQFALAQKIEAITTLSNDSVLIGDWVKIDISLKRGVSDVVLWPSFKETIKVDSTHNLEIINESAVDTTVIKGVITEHKQLTVISFDSGYFIIPPFDFKVVKKEDEFEQLQTSPLLLSVYTLSVDTSQAIKPEKRPLDAPFRLIEIKNELIIGGIILLFLVGVALFLIYRKPKEKPKPKLLPKPKIPPHIIANKKLDELEAKLLWQSDQEKAYHSELSEIVREYLELRYGILALESTSPEIISDLEKQGLKNEIIIKLTELMELSDFVKFAKFKPLPEEHKKAMDISREVIRVTAIYNDISNNVNSQIAKKE